MEAFFTFNKHLEHFLFGGLNIQTAQGIVVLSLLMAFCTVLLEAIKALRVYLIDESSRSPLTYARTEENINERPALVIPLLIPSSQWEIRKRRLKYHVCDSLMYLMQVVTGYIIMLAVMSYNAWIIISVAIGSGVGYFFLGAVRDYILQRHESLSTCSVRTSSQASQNPLEDVLENDTTEIET